MTISNGYITLAEFKADALPSAATSSADDAVIEDIIEAASRYIDNETGRTFYARTETHYFSVPDGRELCMDDDLLTITTLTNGDATVITSGYYLWPRNIPPYSKIVLTQASTIFWQNDSSNNSEYVISVVGTWGYAATAPDNIKRACQMIATQLYHRRMGENMGSITTITPAGVVVTPQDVPGWAAQTIRVYQRRL